MKLVLVGRRAKGPECSGARSVALGIRAAWIRKWSCHQMVRLLFHTVCVLKILQHCMICFTALRPLYFSCKSFRLKTFFCLSNMGKRRRTNNCCLPGQQPLPVGLQPKSGQQQAEQATQTDQAHTLCKWRRHKNWRAELFQANMRCQH